MREIVRGAGVNLATVYYHFRSKLGLMAAVIERRFEPIRQEHLAGLRRADAAAPVRLEALIEAILAPTLQKVEAEAGRDLTVRRLLGRVVTEPNAEFQELLRGQHERVRTAFVEALAKVLPGVPTADLQWRVEFFWGALAFILCNPRKIERMTRGVCNPEDTEAVLDQMVRFFTAGFGAPGSAPRSAVRGRSGGRSRRVERTRAAEG